MTQFVQSASNLNHVTSVHMNEIYFFVDLKCTDTQSFLSSIEAKYFAQPFRWLFWNVNLSCLSLYPFLPDSNVIVANGVRNESFNLVLGEETMRSKDKNIFK